MDKLPPIEKIYEAYSAIADGRIAMFDNYAIVKSSNKEREYTVIWDQGVYAADDNATYWQGYPGYPIVAVLMLQGKLPLNQDVANMFSKVNWAQLNGLTKRDYGKSVSMVFQNRGCTPEEENYARTEANRVYGALKNLDITTKRATKRLRQNMMNSEKE